MFRYKCKKHLEIWQFTNAFFTFQIVANTKVESITNDETSPQEVVIDPKPVLYIAKYNSIIDTSQILNGHEEKDEVGEKSKSSTINER